MVIIVEFGLSSTRRSPSIFSGEGLIIASNCSGSSTISSSKIVIGTTFTCTVLLNVSVVSTGT